MQACLSVGLEPPAVAGGIVLKMDSNVGSHLHKRPAGRARVVGKGDRLDYEVVWRALGPAVSRICRTSS